MKECGHANSWREFIARLVHALVLSIASLLVFTSEVTLSYAEPATSTAVSEEGSDWADVLTAPRDFLSVARRAVAHGRYSLAARNLRNAADMVAKHEEYAVGRERTRLQIAVQALRLTAKDVAAGAITSSSQLDAVLNDTHRDLRAQSTLDR